MAQRQSHPRPRTRTTLQQGRAVHVSHKLQPPNSKPQPLPRSDHKPIHAAFEVFTGSISPQARAELREAIAGDMAAGRFPSLPEKTNHPRVRPPVPVPPVVAAPPPPPQGSKPSRKALPLPPVPSAPKPNVSMDDMLADTSSSSLPVSSDWGSTSFAAPMSTSGWGDTSAAAAPATASSGWGDLLSDSSDPWAAPAAAPSPVPVGTCSGCGW